MVSNPVQLLAPVYCQLTVLGVHPGLGYREYRTLCNVIFPFVYSFW